MELVFIRHTSVDVAPGTCYGQTDVPLRNSFEEEAAEVVRQLHPIEQEGPFDAILTSPLTRCTRLAGFCGYGDAARDNRLKETDFGQWEMCRWDEIDSPHLQRWFDDWQHVPAPGGESLADQLRRVGEVIEELRSQGHKRVLLFAHGGVISCARLHIEQTPPDQIFAKQPPYGGIVRFRI